MYEWFPRKRPILHAQLSTEGRSHWRDVCLHFWKVCTIIIFLYWSSEADSLLSPTRETRWRWNSYRILEEFHCYLLLWRKFRLEKLANFRRPLFHYAAFYLWYVLTSPVRILSLEQTAATGSPHTFLYKVQLLWEGHLLSRCPNHVEDWANFCFFLRKAEF